MGLARAGAVDWRQNRQWLDLVARSGTPLFISWRRSLMTDDIRDEFRRAFRAASGRHATAEPLSWECEAFPTRWRFADGSTVAYDWDLTNETSRCQADGPPPAPGIEDWGFRKEIAAGVDASGLAAIPPDSEPWLENRISRCFFGPIKRPPFNRDELMDDVDYYPDAYLAQLRDEGVNGLWLTVEFRGVGQVMTFGHGARKAAGRTEWRYCSRDGA